MKQWQWSFYLIQHSISCFESRIYSKSLLPSPDLLTVTFIKLMHTQSYPVESSWKSQQIGRVDMKSLGGLSVCQDMFLQRFKVGGLPAVSHGCSVLDSLALALPSFLWRSRNEIPLHANHLAGLRWSADSPDKGRRSITSTLRKPIAYEVY